MYKNAEDLERLVHEVKGYEDFEIAESILLQGQEISDCLEPIKNYLGHCGYSDVALITEDFNYSEGYLPVMLVNINDDGTFDVVKKF